MRWAINGDCPLGWREVFPKGVPGVRFEEADGSEKLTWIEGRPAMDWREGAEGAYAVIAEAMGVRECSGGGRGDGGIFTDGPVEGGDPARAGEERVRCVGRRE